MKILILYHQIGSGAKVATEEIISHYRKKYPEDNLIIYPQDQNRYKGLFSYTRNLLWSIDNFKKNIDNSEKIDCVYTTLFTAVIAKVISQKNKTPIVFHLHGDQKFSRENFYNILLGKVVIFLQKFSIKKASMIFFVSKTARTNFLNNYKLNKFLPKTFIVPNGVNLLRFKKKSQIDIKKLRIKHNLDSNNSIVSYIGRIDKKKGIHNFIKSFEYLKNKNTIYIIAYPTYHDNYSDRYLEKLIKIAKNISLSKFRFIENFKNIQELYQLSDCVVLPSEQEMMPLVILESLACGTPILYSEIKELNGFFGKLKKYNIIKSNSPRDIARVINKILSLSLYEKEIYSQIAKKQIKNFTWDKTIKIIHNHLLKLTTEKYS